MVMPVNFAAGQYQTLKKEIKRLKIGLTNPRNKKVEAYFGSSSTTEAARVEAMQNLDMGKLTLSWNQRCRYSFLEPEKKNSTFMVVSVVPWKRWLFSSNALY